MKLLSKKKVAAPAALTGMHAMMMRTAARFTEAQAQATVCPSLSDWHWQPECQVPVTRPELVNVPLSSAVCGTAGDVGWDMRNRQTDERMMKSG